jgi:hypothetical protein
MSFFVYVHHLVEKRYARKVTVKTLVFSFEIKKATKIIIYRERGNN